MKILLPVVHHMTHAFSLDDSAVIGGVELFQKLVYQKIPGIIPVYITKEDRQKRKIHERMQLAVIEHKPDVIFTNHFSRAYTTNFQKFGIPVVWLQHCPPINSLYNVESAREMLAFREAGGSIYFVGPRQFQLLNSMTMRVYGKELHSSGYINPAFASGLEEVKEKDLYDLVTIGRTDVTKNPFWLHKKASKSYLNSCVITNEPITDSERQIEYKNKNIHWNEPRYTLRDMNHVQTMDILSRCGIYVSTCPVESWGITALEALSRGLHLILVTNSTGTHGSESIAESSDDISLVSSSITTKDFEELCNTILSKETFDTRLDRAERTKRKHSEDNWIDSITKMLNVSNTVIASNNIDFFM